MEIRPDLPEQDPDLGTPESLVRQPPDRFSQAGWRPSWWWLVSALALALIFGLGGLALINMLARPLALFVLAISLAAALSPLVEWLQRRMPRIAAVILVYLVLVLLLVGLVGITVPVLVDQTRSLVESSDTWLPNITNWLAQFGFDPANIFGPLSSQFGQLGRFLISVPLDFFSAAVEFFLVIFTSLYWVLMLPRLRGFVRSFFPSEDRGQVSNVLARMGAAMGGYIRGSAINGVIIAIISYIGYTVIGLPYTLFLAVFAGVMEFFPTIGAILAVGLAVLVSFSVSPTTALITLIFGVVLQQLEGSLLVPIVMRSQADISPVLSIFAVLAGGAIGGILGALVAIPVAAALQVLVRLVIAPALRRANGVTE